MEILKVDMDLIRANPYQPRLDFDEKSLGELAESIRENGIIQPISLRDQGDFYELVAGERRYRAARLAGLKEIEALIVELEDGQSAKFALIENIQRQDLNPIEEALAYEQILEEFKMTQEDLAKRLGKSRSHLSNLLRLLNLGQPIKQDLRRGKLSVGHGKILAGIKDLKIQEELWREITDQGLSIRQTRELLEKIQGGSRPEPDSYIRSLEEDLMDYFGTKVSLVQKKEKGIIEIEFYGEEDLGRILDMFS